MLAGEILTNKVILFEILINLESKDILTVSVLDKSFHKKTKSILQNKHFYNAKLGYDVDQLLSQTNPGDFTYEKWFRFAQNKNLSYAEALYTLSNSYLCIPELFDIKSDLNTAKILCQAAAKAGHHEAIYSLAVAPLWGIYDGVTEPLDVVLVKIKDLAETGNIWAVRFLKSFGRMRNNEMAEILDEY